MILNINKRQILFAAIYALIYPISQYVGGTCATIGLVLVSPFAYAGYFAGMILALTFNGKDITFIVGMTISVLIQILIIFQIYNALTRLWIKTKNQKEIR